MVREAGRLKFAVRHSSSHPEESMRCDPTPTERVFNISRLLGTIYSET
jgi:hypothetical protein